MSIRVSKSNVGDIVSYRSKLSVFSDVLRWELPEHRGTAAKEGHRVAGDHGPYPADSK